MTIQIKAAVDAGVDGLVVVAVREDGSRSLPEIIDKERLVSQIAGTIHQMKCGCDSWGIDRNTIIFSLPVELHMVCRYTLFRDDMAPMSVLEAIANAAGLRPDQVIAEYPAADRAEAVIKLSEALRDRAIQHANEWMEKAATARMGLAAAIKCRRST